MRLSRPCLTTLTRRSLFGAALGLTLYPGAKALGATAFSRDSAGRILIAAHVNGRGPFRFMLDTGSAVSAISLFLARELRLTPAGDAPSSADLLGSTGRMPVTRVRAQSLEVDGRQMNPPPMAVMPEPAREEGAAQGVLGADLLQHYPIDISFAGSTVTLGQRVEGARLHNVVIARHLGSLIALRARIANIDLPAILDTGAQRTIGNSALANALHLKDHPAEAAVVSGVDGQALAASERATPSLRLGRHALPALPLLYADLPVFAHWGWSGTPSILLGMDLLNRLSHLRIDYPRQRVAIAP